MPHGPIAITPKTILLVDDAPDNLAVLALLLVERGYVVDKALNGAAAFETIYRSRPDLILLDVYMPDISGYEICERLKADPVAAEIPIIFISALDNAKDKLRAFQVGGADYISKPFQMEEVLARIEHQLLIQSQRQQLKVEIEERQRAEKALEVYLHAVSHDLRNPVLGMTMILNHHLSHSPPEQTAIALTRDTLEQMRRSCDRQLLLINSLVEAQQFEQQGVPLVLRPIALADVLQEVMGNWSLALEEQDIAVKTVWPDSMPWVAGDANYLWRVFDNLIANALKYNPQPRPRPLTLTITATARETDILCRVADNGVGIPAAIADRAFDRYQRGDKTKNHLGLGLGLYVCRQIIQAHGGDIGLNMAVEQGAEIWFTLPQTSGTAASHHGHVKDLC